MNTARLTNLALCLVAASLFLASPAFAQDAFQSSVTWFVGGPARGIAMFAVAAAAVALWFFMGSLRIAGFVLGGGLILANADTIVSWMGF